MPLTILVLGCGYVGERLLTKLQEQPNVVLMPVSRDMAKIRRWSDSGYQPLHMHDTPATLDTRALQHVNIIIDSIPLSRTTHIHASQPDWLPTLLARCPRLQYAVYLSSSSVYGDAGGAWVNETWPCRPSSERGQQRLLAEQCWQRAALPTAVFRLSGIYGPQRNLIKRLQTGNYPVVRWQPARFSNRIHVDDIVQCLEVAIAQRPTGVFNISDDHPLPHAEYVQQLAACIGAPPPTVIAPEEAANHLSPAALAFFGDSKRLRNQRLHQELCPTLCYPDFLCYFSSSESKDW